MERLRLGNESIPRNSNAGQGESGPAGIPPPPVATNVLVCAGAVIPQAA